LAEETTREIHKLVADLPALDWWSRRRAIENLIVYPEGEFVAFLEEGIRDHADANIRNVSMEVYAALGARAFRSLSSLMEDDDPEVRLFSVNVLCQIGDRKFLPLLFTSIKDPDMNVRAATVEALGKIGDPAALESLQEALGDEPWVALAAINAIGRIGGEQALLILYDCLKQESGREMAIDAIENAGNKQSIRYLALFLGSDDLRDIALKAIVKIAEREHFRPGPEYFISLAHTLKEMYLSADSDMRKQAFIALCWIEDILAVPYLIEGIKDDDLQEYAIEGLLHIGKKAVCSIVDHLKQSAGAHRVVLAKMLTMLGENMALLQFTEDDDPEVRTEVAIGIASIPMERATRALTKMLLDPYEEVRLAASKSLSPAKK
jgi:HEAT repeat protein